MPAALFNQNMPLKQGMTRAEDSLHGQNPPAHLPRRGPWWARRFAWWFLRRNGWDIRGLYPDASRFIIIGAPHSSNFDWFWGMFVQWALGVRFSFLIKHVFFIPPLGSFMRFLGGVPVNRARVRGLVTDAINLFSNQDPKVLFITPEGRTKPVKRLKRGFYEIAKGANIPVFVVSFRYEERVISLDGYLDLSGDFTDVEARLKTHYGPIKGRHRGYLDKISGWAIRPLPKGTRVYE